MLEVVTESACQQRVREKDGGREVANVGLLIGSSVGRLYKVRSQKHRAEGGKDRWLHVCSRNTDSQALDLTPASVLRHIQLGGVSMHT